MKRTVRRMGREPAIGTMYEAGTHRLPDLFRMGNRKESAHKIGDSWGWKTMLKVLISEEKDNLNEKKLLTTYKELRGFAS
jgi:hypothetical protein